MTATDLEHRNLQIIDNLFGIRREFGDCKVTTD